MLSSYPIDLEKWGENVDFRVSRRLEANAVISINYIFCILEHCRETGELVASHMNSFVFIYLKRLPSKLTHRVYSSMDMNSLFEYGYK